MPTLCLRRKRIFGVACMLKLPNGEKGCVKVYLKDGFVCIVSFHLRKFSIPSPLSAFSPLLAGTENQTSHPFQKLYQPMVYLAHGLSSSILLIAQEIITGHDRSELSLLLKRLHVIPNSRPNSNFLPTWWRELS